MTSASLCGQSSSAPTEACTTPDDGSRAWTLTETHATLGSAGPEGRIQNVESTSVGRALLDPQVHIISARRQSQYRDGGTTES